MAQHTRARPEVVKERQVHAPNPFATGSIGGDYWTNGTNGLHTPPGKGSPMRTYDDERLMRTSPGGVRMAKHSRLLCYHQDTPIPLKHQERLAYNIPNDWDAERRTRIRLHAGLSRSSPASAPSPCLDFGTRDNGLQCRSLDFHDFTTHGCKYQYLEQTRNGYNSLCSKFGDSCSHSDEPGLVCSLQNSLTDVQGPDDERFQVLYNQEPCLENLRKDNEQKSGNRLVLNPEFNKDYKLDSPYPLPSFGSKPRRFADSMIRGKGRVSGLKSNVDEIKLDGDLQNESQVENVAYSSADCPVVEHQGTKATRMRAHDREYNNRQECNCEGVSSQIGKNPKNLSTEYHVTKKPVRGQFASPSGAEEWHSLESGKLSFDQNKGRSTGGLAVRMKQGIVRELNSELVKRNPEQSRSNTRSVVQLVFASNKPDKEKEADEFITLIDQSFADFCSDKACVVEKTQDDRSINGANVDTRAKRKQCLNLKQDRTVCSRNTEESYRRANGRESYITKARTPNGSDVVQQSFCARLDPHSNTSRTFPENSSFEQIKRQLFSEERNDVIDEKTNCLGKLSFVRTIHQSVGEKESVGDRIDDDFVYALNQSVGSLAHNNNRNPEVDIILKTPRGKLAERKSFKSPFVRTIYQDCDQGSSSSDYVNTSGRPVSPFSDSIISAVAFCSQDNTHHEYLRLRRRDRRLRYLSEASVFSTLGLRTLGAMSSSGSSSSCGEKSNASCVRFVGDDLRSSELTEQALRAHTLALKASSPSIRRRPTLDQFFGKVSEQGLQDSSSEQSDFSSSSDSVLVVQRTNKVNLTPASGLLNGRLRSPNKSSRALRLKAWKNSHETIYKSTRTATPEDISERPIANGQRIENPGNPSRDETSDKDNNIFMNHTEANCVKHDGLIGECGDMALGRPKEISEVNGGNHNRITERTSRFAAGNDNCNANSSTGLEVSDRLDCEAIDFAPNMMNNGKLSKSKSVGSEDSFEEVYVEPELLACSPPSTDRSSDSTDSSNHVNHSEDSVSSDVGKKDSLDVFVGSASAILERVKRLKLKYNHKSTNIPSVNIEKDENGNVVGKSLGDNVAFEDGSGSGCLIPSPTLLKDSPRIKTIDKSDVFSRRPDLNTFDFFAGDVNDKKSIDVDFSASKRPDSSLEEQRNDFNQVKSRDTCYSSVQDIFGTLTAKVNDTVDEANTTQAQRHLDCLDNTGRISLAETKDEFKDIYKPLFVEKKLANIDGMLHGAPSDETSVFVTEKKNEMTYKQCIVEGLSKFESDGRAPVYEQTDSKDKRRSEGLHTAERNESMQADVNSECCKQRNDTTSQNGKIESGIKNEPKYGKAFSDLTIENSAILKAGYSVSPVKAYSIQANGENLLNSQGNSAVNLNRGNDVAFASTTCSSSPIDESKNIVLFDQLSSYSKQNQAPIQRPYSTDSSIPIDNKGYFSDTENAESCRLNGLSGKFEEINSDNGVEISPLSDRKDNIERGDFSLRRDGLSSLDNMIMGESKEGSIYLAGINDKTYEGPACNGISVQARNEKQVRWQPDLHIDQAPRIVKAEGSDIFHSNGLNLVDLDNTLSSDSSKVASEDPKKEGVKGRSEIDHNCGNASSDSLQQYPGDLPLRKDAHGENLCDKDLNRLNNIDSAGFIDGEIDRALVSNENIVDMASAKGVSDLKKRFENYQSKSEKKVDITKGSVTKQQLVLSDTTLRNEHADAKTMVSSKGFSKLGALKSVFESEKTEPLKPALTRIISPKLQRAGFVLGSMPAGNDNRDRHDIMSSSDMSKTENCIDDKERKILVKDNTEKENLTMESRGCQAQVVSESNLTAKSGTSEKLQDRELKKPAKIPPPVKRKPSLKKKGSANVNGILSKNQEKIDVVDSKHSAHETLRDFAKERKEQCLTGNGENIDKEYNFAAAEENHTADKSDTIFSSGHSISPGHKVEKGKAQSIDRKSYEDEKDEEHIVGLDLTKVESGYQELEEGRGTRRTGLPLKSKLDDKDTIDRVSERVVKENSAAVRSFKPETGHTNAGSHDITMSSDAQAYCEDDMNEEETIASLLSQLEKACIPTDKTAVEKGGMNNADIMQAEFDNFADSKKAMDTNEVDQKLMSDEIGLESNREKLHSTLSETISRKNKGDTGCKTHQSEIFCDKLQDNYPVVTEFDGSKNEQRFKSVDEKRREDLSLCHHKKEKITEECDSFGTPIYRKHLTNRKSDESIEIPCTYGITMATELSDVRSIDKNCEIACHPICGLEDSQDLVTEESDRLKEGLLLTENENNGGDCGTNRGKRFCKDDICPLIAEISEQDQDQKTGKKMLSARKLSSSSGSSLDESDIVRPTALDYDNIPSVGLPALLRQCKRDTNEEEITEEVEELVQQKQPHHYISYSSIKSDVGTNGMYCKHEKQFSVEELKTDVLVSKGYRDLGLGSTKHDGKLLSSGLDLKREVDDGEEKELENDDLVRIGKGDFTATENAEMCVDFDVTVDNRMEKSNSPVVIQSVPMTLERNGSLNIAKVSPYFHDRSSRKFTEPVTKFGGGIFSGSWQDNQSDMNVLTKETQKCGESHIGCPVMRDSDTKVSEPMMAELGKLEVVLKVPTESMGDNCINLGVISTEGFSHWNDVRKEAARNVLEYVKFVSEDCLGIGDKDIEYLEIGKHKINRGEGNESPKYDKMDEVSCRCIVQFHGTWTGSVALMSYQLLIPKRTLEKYESLIMNHRCLIFCGQSGTGKSYLASKLGFHVAGRFSDIGNNNVIEPFHAVNVNAERWKEIKEMVKQNVSKSMPIVLVIDGFTPDFHEGIENLALLLKQLDYSNLYVIAALNQTTQEITVKWQNSIRWIWLDVNEEPVQGLLTRYLRKKFLNNNPRCSSKELFEIADWMSSVWRLVNRVIESFHSAEQTIGPAMFFSCPSKQNEIEEWFADTWNYSLAPYILHTLRTGLKLFGQRCEWTDPLEWILNTYPWKKEKDFHTNLKKIRKSDVGYWDVSKDEKNANSSSGNQVRLMNFLRRLETMVDNRTISTATKPGTTQRRIYLESTL